MGRRTLWTNLDRYNENLADPWLVLEDFNNVLHADERSNGQSITQYEIRDFQQCCSKLGLVDTGYSGTHLTWTNNSTWSKLDRVMTNNRWISDGLRAHAHFGFHEKLSDHSPGLFLKEPLKELNKKNLSQISSRAAVVEADLYEIQQKLHDNISDPLLQEQMVKMKQTAFKLAEAERSYCSQLGKIKYLKNNDRGSKSFHDLIKSHRNRCQIVSIILLNGSRSKSQQEVNESFIEFYKNLLGSSSSCTPIDRNVLLGGRLVNDDQATALICAITDKEIKDSLFSIGDDKAPGPDGYFALFFKRAWSIIGKDFCEAIKEFFSLGQILK
ncbi:uncharacterized protein LOC130766107 [Actinidia eriantha]|uniref:uncharacterized protein LOC130766107 n=1 Tax=Actinidia eriantha TaxID=165200 RepID=UPI00258E3020|nr:uncharacterized protein LOC130766107 [Actinidia eriantha]